MGISFAFQTTCSLKNRTVLEINKEFLNHDYYTDIITFDYSETDVVSGDLFISIDRIKDNAKILNIPYKEELHRVIIHGILHLLGNKDKTESESKKMRLLEDECLSVLFSFLNEK